MRKEVEKGKSVNEVTEKNGGVAAFFDLDGTLIALPSLERRLFRTLRYQRAISAENYFLWLKEALRLTSRGINAVLQSNKMYLRGVQTSDERDEGERNSLSSHKSGHPSQLGASQAWGQASSPPRRNPRLPVPSFFSQAIERVVWHARQGHTIMLVSGTLEPLARAAAHDLQDELAARGIAVTIRFCATRLEESDGRFTGRILGQAMFGEAKAHAAKRFAEKMRLDLTRCYAYGDSTHDRWLLSAVGNPIAVNPSRGLAHVAQKRSWPVLRWNTEKELTQRIQSLQRPQRGERKNTNAAVEKSALKQAGPSA